jgi:hypothetical protein
MEQIKERSEVQTERQFPHLGIVLVYRQNEEFPAAFRLGVSVIADVDMERFAPSAGVSLALGRLKHSKRKGILRDDLLNKMLLNDITYSLDQLEQRTARAYDSLPRRFCIEALKSGRLKALEQLSMNGIPIGYINAMQLAMQQVWRNPSDDERIQVSSTVRATYQELLSGKIVQQTGTGLSRKERRRAAKAAAVGEEAGAPQPETGGGESGAGDLSVRTLPASSSVH